MQNTNERPKRRCETSSDESGRKKPTPIISADAYAIKSESPIGVDSLGLDSNGDLACEAAPNPITYLTSGASASSLSDYGQFIDFDTELADISDSIANMMFDKEPPRSSLNPCAMFESDESAANTSSESSKLMNTISTRPASSLRKIHTGIFMAESNSFKKIGDSPCHKPIQKI
jgi:hypothetical protein